MAKMTAKKISCRVPKAYFSEIAMIHILKPYFNAAIVFSLVMNI